MGITCSYTHADTQIKPIIIYVTLKETCIFRKKGECKDKERVREREGRREREKKVHCCLSLMEI